MSFRRRSPADWVYRPDLYDGEGGLFEGLGTYTRNASALNTGSAAVLVKWLYDSHNYIQNLISITGIPTVLPASARAEGAKTKVIRTQGSFIIRPSSWAIGSLAQFGVRFGIFEQDPNTGLALLDPVYTMYENNNVLVPTGMASAAMFANDRQWQHERRFGTVFSDNAAHWSFRFNIGVNRRLKPNEGYAMFFENPTAWGVNLQLAMLFMRTLVADDGA